MRSHDDGARAKAGHSTALIERAFLFADIESSTPLWEQYPDLMARAAERLEEAVSAAVVAAGGKVVGRTGDAIDAAFADVAAAAIAATQAQRTIDETDWGELGAVRVRMAIDAGHVAVRSDRYYGSPLNRLGRILGAGHGGQVLLSGAARAQLAAHDEFETRDLGEYRFKGIGRPQPVYQLLIAGLRSEFPPLRVGGDARPRGTPSRGNARTLRGYELREELGRGDFGVVHLGFQASVGREVAVKVIRPEYANRPDFVRRFEAEAQVVAQLEHPHIVTLFDFWRDPDGAYLVMSYLRGGSLAGALRRGPWHAEPALALLEQVGSALSHAHRHGIIHRDLKPANILLDEDGNAYLSDFGIASRPADGAGRPMSSSLAYLPPEELHGGALDHRSDIFSLGVLTFELLTGTGATGRDLPALIRSRADLPTPLADVLCAATHERIAERPPSVEEFLDAVRPLLDPGAGRSAARTRALPRMPIRNPYKGLRAFGEADAGDFYGREALVDELVDAVARSRLVAVVGPSGSGKSSAVRAGLVPALRAGRGTDDRTTWLVSETYPGSYPFEELEAAFTRVAVEDPGDLGELLGGDERGLLRVAKRILPGDDSELVLIIDQFEELFSLVESEETRRLFLAGLTALATDERSRVRVVLTIRADFFDRPLAYPGFGDLFTASLVTVTPPSEASLEQAISRPAHNVGLQLEPGLVSEIVTDVQDQPGGLPLLQYALTELFERRDGDRLTIAGYRESGGVTGALARRAEAVYEHLPADVRDTARQVFLRLVALGEGTEDTRRRVARQELTDLPGSRQVEHVLDAFGAHRLLSFDRDTSTRDPTVEVAHEALLRHWARLREWVDGARDDLRQHRRLQQAAAEWQDHGEDPAYLLPPERLGPIEGWFAGTTVLLSETERRYVDSSAERREELEAAEAERRAREEVLERRAMRRLRAAVAVLAVGVLVAVGLTALALAERGRADEQRVVAEEAQARAEAQQAIAEEQRAIAEEQERTATARELATAALAELEADAERAILLALEAIDTTRDVDGSVIPEAEAALRTAIRASHLERTLPTGGGISLAPDGRLATAGVDGVLTVWDPETWEPLLEIEGGHTDVPVRLGDALLSLEPDDVDFSPDGERLVVANAEFQGTIIDAQTGEVLTELEERILRPRFSPDGTLVAGLLPQDVAGAGAAAVIGVWDATTGAIQHRFHHQDDVFDYAFSPDGSRLASTTFGLSHVWNLEDGEEVWALLAGLDDFPGLAVSYTPDGEQIVFGVLNGDIVFRAAGDGGLVRAFPGHDVPAQGGMAFSADGSRIVTVGQLEARVWNAATGQRLFQLAGHAGVIRDVELSPDGSRVYTSSQDGETRIWDVSVEGGVEYAFAAALVQPASTWPAFSPDGRHLATAGPNGDVSVLELDTMEVVRTLSTVDATHMTAYSGDGTLLATSSVLGYFDAPQTDWRDAIEVWDAETGERLAVFDQPQGPGWDLGLNHDGSLLAWAGEIQLRVFDLTSGREIVSQPSPGGGFSRVAFTPDGDLFVGGAFGGRLIDPTTGELQVELEDAGRINDADFTPDGMLVTGASAGGGFQLWDPHTGQPLRRLPGEANLGSVSVWEHLVATGGDDYLSVLDIETGALRFTVEVPQMIRVRISPDGRYLLANHGSRGMHLYVLPIDDLLDLARSRVTRSLTDAECEDFLRLPSCPSD